MRAARLHPPAVRAPHLRGALARSALSFDAQAARRVYAVGVNFLRMLCREHDLKGELLAPFMNDFADEVRAHRQRQLARARARPRV